MSKTQAQEWLDYLLVTLVEERDPELRRLCGFFQVMKYRAKQKSISKSDLTITLDAVIEYTLTKVTNKHRSTELLKGVKQFILKELDK